MRILVLRGGALGDFSVTLPALGLLRHHWPDARIELVGNARAAELGVRGGYLDAAHSQDEARWSALYAAAGEPLPSALAGWLAEFDLIVNYWPDPDDALSARLPLRPGQTYLRGSAQPTLAPAGRHFCAPLRALGLSTTDYRSLLPLPAPAATIPSSIVNPGSRAGPLALHPGSGSTRKNWPRERWEELIARLDCPVLLVLGDAEQHWHGLSGTPLDSAGGRSARPAFDHGPTTARPTELAASLPLPDLAARLARCRLFVGHDSGVSHLAAAVGTPCVLLFGPTDPAMWAPPGAHVRILRHGESLAAIHVDEVLALVK